MTQIQKGGKLYNNISLVVFKISFPFLSPSLWPLPRYPFWLEIDMILLNLMSFLTSKRIFTLSFIHSFTLNNGNVLSSYSTMRLNMNWLFVLTISPKCIQYQFTNALQFGFLLYLRIYTYIWGMMVRGGWNGLVWNVYLKMNWLLNWVWIGWNDKKIEGWIWLLPLLSHRFRSLIREGFEISIIIDVTCFGVCRLAVMGLLWIFHCVVEIRPERKSIFN